MRFFANLCPIPLGFDSGSAHWRLLVEYSPGWASPSPYLNVGGNNPFIGFDGGSCNARRAYLLCLLSSNGSAGTRAASFINGPIGVVLKAPVIALACLFISCWISWAQVFWPRHQISAPYRATDCTAAIWTFLTSPGGSP